MQNIVDQLLDHSPNLIFVRDGDGRYLQVSRSYCEVFGKVPSELLGRTPPEVFGEGIGQYLLSSDRQVFELKAALDMDIGVPSVHGPRAYRTRKFPLLDEQGCAYAVCGIATDVSEFERPKAMEALRDAALAVSTVQGEGLFRDMVRSLAAILRVEFVFVAETKRDDPNILRMLAFFSDGVLGQSFDYPYQGTPCETVLGKTYRAYVSDLPRRFPGDTEFSNLGLQSYAGFPLSDSDGNALGVIAVASRSIITVPDIVESVLKIFASRASAEIQRLRSEEELRAREAQLRQVQKMETIGQLTGGIAHDFNNILTSILGYLMLAAERLEEKFDDEKLTRYLDEANGAALRARDLIKQMLTFSRGQRGTPRRIDLAQMIGEGINMLRPTLPASIAINTRLERGQGTVLLDPVHLGQILLNLCINARDAMDNAGRLSVRVAPVAFPEAAICASCKQQVQGEFMSLMVRDTGSGITPQVQERMFEPFYTTKELGKGTGMGLATVHGIVHEYDGHMLVDSLPGKGTRFRVLFPLLPPVEEDGMDVGGVLQGKDRMRLQGRVLVVDDERAVGAFMRDLLLGWGLQVTVESNPLRAQEMVEANPDDFDLLITDQSMPKLTGIVLAGRLHREAPTLPILLYTGYSEDIPAAVLESAGVKALLRKPVDPTLLFDTISQLLLQHRAHRAAGTNM